MFGSGVLDPKGLIGEGERLILLDSTVIMLAVIIPVILCTLAFAFWYRAGNRRAKRHPDFAYSGPVELVTWSVPALIVMFLGGIAWIGSHQLDPRRAIGDDQPLEVQVVSLDWKWLFIYPQQGVASVNQLVLPISKPVRFQLTSASVMNSFFVPQLGSQIYTMAGMVTRLNLRADHPGTYPGISAQFSGDGFSDMRFDTRAVSQAEFDRWLAQTRMGGEPLDLKVYGELAKPGVESSPRSFARVGPGLFEAIVKARGSTPAQLNAALSPLHPDGGL